VTPVMSLRSRIISMRSVPAAQASLQLDVCTQTALTHRSAGRGYGDGIHRSLGNRETCCCAGSWHRLFGIISMDVTMIDVTDIEDATIGDVATITARTAAKAAGELGGAQRGNGDVRSSVRREPARAAALRSTIVRSSCLLFLFFPKLNKN